MISFLQALVVAVVVLVTVLTAPLWLTIEALLALLRREKKP